LFDKNDPLSSTNRRISIVVLNKRTEDAMLQEDGNAQTAVPDAGELASDVPSTPIKVDAKN
jgi:hypothetical protein